MYPFWKALCFCDEVITPLLTVVQNTKKVLLAEVKVAENGSKKLFPLRAYKKWATFISLLYPMPEKNDALHHIALTLN